MVLIRSIVVAASNAILLLSIVGRTNCQSGFARSEKLTNDYFVDWEVDFLSKSITFTATAQTTGYVGFGLNYKGNMKGADIVVGGVYSNGTSYSSDMHGLGSSRPVLDRDQDWTLLNASEANGWTTLKFKRGFSPCDLDEDIPFTNDTLRLIFAIGASDNLSYHRGRRGSKSLLLLSPPPPKMDVSRSWDITVDTEIPADRTAYWVTIHKSPAFDTKTHVTGFEVHLEGELAKTHTHHIILYHCLPGSGPVLDKWVGNPGRVSDDPDIRAIRPYCLVFFYLWAVGGSSLFLPEHVGLPVGGTSENEYLLLEVHYDNPNRTQGIQYELGIRIYYTPQLRINDGGIMYTGIDVRPRQIIPPNVEEFVHVGHCSSECTRDKLPDDGINVFNAHLHSHLNGRKIKVRHFRGNNELPWLAYDGNYDFNYQEYRPLREEIKVRPGDHLSVECFYNTTWNRPFPLASYGGESTQHEMCIAFLFYYPLVKSLDVCGSYFDPIEDIYETLGVEFDDYHRNDDPLVRAPEEFMGLTLTDVLSTKLTWTSEMLEKLQFKLRWDEQKTICASFRDFGAANFSNAMYPNVTVYKPVYTCEA